MNIRRARPHDAKRINELLYQVAAIHAEGRPDIFKNAAKKYSDDELVDIINCDTTPIFVAVDDDDFVLAYAFCIYKITKDDILLRDKKTLYIDDICVDENARGSHIGRNIYDYVSSFAKENDFDDINLNVWAFNDKARAFYEKCGMTAQRIIMEQKLK